MKRLQFLMEDEQVKQLDALVEETGLKTRTQLLNSSLTLFEWAVRERKSGHVIASVDEKADKYKEIDLPGLPDVKHQEDIDELIQKLWGLLKVTNSHMQVSADLIGYKNTIVELEKSLDKYITQQRSIYPQRESAVEARARAESAAVEARARADGLAAQVGTRAEELRKHGQEVEERRTKFENAIKSGRITSTKKADDSDEKPPEPTP